MSRLTVAQIMTQIASTVNQEATAPSTGGDEYNLWLAYINRAQFEWENSTDWEELRATFLPGASDISGSTVMLPAGFKKIAAAPRLYVDNIQEGIAFPEVLPDQTGMFSEIQKYVTIRGDVSNGYDMFFHPATLASGASLVIQYFSMPTSLATSSDVPVMSDSQFLVDRTIAYILEARSDARFQLEENKARERLLTMVESNTAKRYNSYANPNPVLTTNAKAGFRLGRDG